MWPASAAFAFLLFAIQQKGFVFRWRQRSTKISLDEIGVFLGLLLLPAANVVLALAASSMLNQGIHRRPLQKAAFNVAQYSLAGLAAATAAALLHALAVPAPFYAAIAPPMFALGTGLLVSALFSRLEGAPVRRVFADRFADYAIVGSTLGVSLGLVAYALFALHPLAVLAAVPLFVYLSRFGRLSEWADDELTTHRLVASVTAEVAGQADLDTVAQRILSTCHDLFDCGEASLTLVHGEERAPRMWRVSYGESAGFGGVAAEISGPDGARIGALSVFPRPGQHRYGEREHQLLRTVAGTAAAAAANASALRASREAYRELTASEARYRALFDVARGLILVLDAEGRVVDANPSAARELGGAAMGRPLDDLVAPAARGGQPLFERIAAEGELFDLETRLRGVDGRELVALLDARALDKSRYVVFARDITTLKGLEAELRGSMEGQRETIKRLENMNRELEEFTLWTTHDMREPLRSIGTIAGFLHEDIGAIPEDEARDLARRISEGAERLKDRVKALHAFSLIVQRDDEFQDVDMGRVVEGVVASLEARIHERRATIVLPNAPFPVVRAQPHRIDQVFGNLVENALKYGRAERPIVEIGFTETPTEWRFHVRDNGPGIPVTFHDRIFQLFQRGPDSGEAGSGAGLAIVKRIAEQHGGRAWVESEPGHGACFLVALPKRAPLVSLATVAPRKPF